MSQVKHPKGLMRWFFRAPIFLYRLKLGWILGKRLMLINHIGRKSGQPRQTVVEVARYDEANDHYYVCSGFGKQANWYRNLEAHPETEISVGRRTVIATAILLSPEESGNEMLRYVKTYPNLAKRLMRMIGHEVPTTEDGYRQLAQARLPFVRFVPHSPK